MGVTFRVGWALESLGTQGGRISHATVRDRRGLHTVTADWFIAAIPLERMARLLTPDMLTADSHLEGIKKLKTDWMSGLQFYLREPLSLTNGHVNYVNSPFALTSISQAQFWKRDLSSYGDGTVKESFSTIISDWVTPGIVYGKAARDCTPREIAADAWAQIKAHLNDNGVESKAYFDPPIHRQPPYAGGDDHLPVTEEAADRTLIVPYFSQMSREQVARVAAVLKGALARVRG